MARMPPTWRRRRLAWARPGRAEEARSCRGRMAVKPAGTRYGAGPVFSRPLLLRARARARARARVRAPRSRARAGARARAPRRSQPGRTLLFERRGRLEAVGAVRPSTQECSEA